MKFIFILLASLSCTGLPVDPKNPSWNVIDKVLGKYTVVNDAIKVTYPKGGYSSPKTGLQFHSNPIAKSIINQNEMTLSYSIFVPKDFVYMMGGKLPGLYAGEPVSCSGGKGESSGIKCATFRLMWRQNGQMEVYGYMPITQELCTRPNVKCGGDHVSLMRGMSSLQSGKINTISLFVSFISSRICLTVNSKRNCLDNLQLRTNPSLGMSGIFFSTFYGGSTKAWSPPSDQFLLFSKFELNGSGGVSRDLSSLNTFNLLGVCSLNEDQVLLQ